MSLKYLLVVLGLALTIHAPTLHAQRTSVTPVEGDSWLSHLHRSFEESSMGRTWHLGPQPEAGKTLGSRASVSPQSSAADTVILHGADLYRLNCQGCHGEFGLGAPPEISSIINPVRATSASLVLQRMKSVGAEITHAQAIELAGQAKAALLDRLHHGGEDMPSFSYLADTEIRSLIAYLNLLANVPGTNSQIAVSESHARVGELLVKSTCHTCHSAIGLNPTPAELAAGAIPPLSTLPARVGRAGLIQKVTVGAPVRMGETADLDRGRMPVFSYLREDEVADVYTYLESYPPAGAPIVQAPSQREAAQSAKAAAPPSSAEGSGKPVPQNRPHLRSSLKTWSVCVTLTVLAWMGIGLAFTQREIRRLSNHARVRRSPPAPQGTSRQPMVTSSQMSPTNPKKSQPPYFTGTEGVNRASSLNREAPFPDLQQRR